MPSDPEDRPGTQPVLRPAEMRPGVLVHPTADRRLAVEDWLLSAHPSSPRRGRVEWREQGLTVLALGSLFSALRIPGRVVQSVAASTDPADIDATLREALEGGPVICDVHGPRYYALVPATVPRTWRDAVDDRRRDDVECLGHGAFLGVPRLDADEFPERGTASYWSVPMESAGVLCAPLSVARVIAAGVAALAEDGQEKWPANAPLTRASHAHR